MDSENQQERRKRLEKEMLDHSVGMKKAQQEISSINSNCSHSWGETEPDHVYHKAYTSPGDTPGTMGVDFRGPCHVPARTDHRWKRVCEKCGKVEKTTATKTTTTETPRF